MKHRLVANSTFDQWKKVAVDNSPAMTLPNTFKESGQIEREKSVDNLRDLMQQKKRANGAPLPNQVGTNLYVRNYKEIPGAKENSLVKNPLL